MAPAVKGAFPVGPASVRFLGMSFGYGRIQQLDGTSLSARRPLYARDDFVSSKSPPMPLLKNAEERTTAELLALLITSPAQLYDPPDSNGLAAGPSSFVGHASYGR